MASVRNRNETLIAYLFLAPFLIAFVVFLGYPILYSLYLSFHETTVFTDWFNIFGDMRWAGFGNYSDLLFNDFEFWWSLYRTLIYALLMIPAQIVIGFFLAVLLREKLPGRDFFRGAYFMPHVLDVFVVGTIWVLIYSPNYGLLDVLLTRIGVDYFSSTGVLGNPWTALPAIAFALVLKSAGFGMILFLAAMSNIPESVYEAADIDGANFWQKHRHVTFPLVKPIILFLIITGLMGALNAFTEIYAMAATKYAQGGPFIDAFGHTVGVTKVSGFYLYKTFEQGDYGRAAAMSFLLLIVAFTISVFNARLLRSEKV
ncbi:MAG: sugar ABC transporter permease [Blastocatellia bacterium]|jgi:ABC-type sugar transport system permease subunit|nr:sugar ABC transporter permease [Blastocatellia bacterium]